MINQLNAMVYSNVIFIHLTPSNVHIEKRLFIVFRNIFFYIGDFCHPNKV